jgi:hypothetical protein
MNDDEQPVSIAAAARALGIARQTLAAQVASGIVPTHGGKVVVSEARAARERSLSTRGGRRTPDSAPPPAEPTDQEPAAVSAPAASRGVTLGEARRSKEEASARLKWNEVAIQESKLVDGDEYDRVMFRFWQTHRQVIQNWPARISAMIAAAVRCDQVSLECELDKHVRELLQHLSEIPLPPPPREDDKS